MAEPGGLSKGERNATVRCTGLAGAGVGEGQRLPCRIEHISLGRALQARLSLLASMQAVKSQQRNKFPASSGYSVENGPEERNCSGTSSALGAGSTCTRAGLERNSCRESVQGPGTQLSLKFLTWAVG